MLHLNAARVAAPQDAIPAIGAAHVLAARTLMDAVMPFAPTPTIALPVLADGLGVSRVLVKDESGRMGLGSFKGLGGGHAIARLAEERVARSWGRSVPPEALRSRDAAAALAGMTVACASAGNHGLSVATAARTLGIHSAVWLSKTVPAHFETRLRAIGAKTVREGAAYEDSMAAAEARAGREGWILVSDSSWDGYTQIPLEVMRGYGILCAEAADACEAEGGPATHIFVQAGVGGLAAATADYLRQRWGETLRVVVVEPEAAPCLMESVRAGRPLRIAGGSTRLGRLDCKEPSLLAYRLLSRHADAFLTVTDDEADAAARTLAEGGIRVSPCGGAGAAGLIAVCRDPAMRAALELDRGSRVLLFGTEGAL